MDASILLKPLLSRGELRCIGATTMDKFRKFIEKDPGLERRFQQVTQGFWVCSDKLGHAWQVLGCV